MILVLIFMLKPGDAEASTEPEFELEFEPGELVRLGPKPEDLPEKIIVEELVAEEEIVETETVTKEEEPPPPPPEEEKPKPKPDKPKKKPKEKPDPTKKDAKKADRNQDSNTPHKDLPTIDQLPGDRRIVDLKVFRHVHWVSPARMASGPRARHPK